MNASPAFTPLNIAVLTVSDTRTSKNDTSGDLLSQRVLDAGHQLSQRTIVIDDVYKLRAQVSNWIANDHINAILVTGGTGFTARDNTPEALSVLFDKQVEGFGELFRQISATEIGTSTIQSRALAGMANSTVIFCMPGSTNACKTAWDKVIKKQLDSSHKPCNFVMHLNTTSTTGH
jgi:molybdenum cofactor biosynthesis protein B